MKSGGHQLSLPFACIDFPDRTTVSVAEIAAKIGKTERHILDHIEAGRLVALNTALVDTRSSLRVTVDEYRRWVLSLLTAPARRTFLQELPHATLLELQAEIQLLLSPAAAASTEALAGSLVTRAPQSGI